MNHRKVITTGCCDKSNVHKVVKLSFNRDFNADFYFKYNKLKPVWTSLGFTLYKEHIFESNVEVMYCPFCGVNVPEIEINEDAVKNHKIHESEDMHYCDTCNERNMCCDCLPPEFRWKPVGIDIEIPINEFDDDE